MSVRQNGAERRCWTESQGRREVMKVEANREGEAKEKEVPRRWAAEGAAAWAATARVSKGGRRRDRRGGEVWAASTDGRWRRGWPKEKENGGGRHGRRRAGGRRG